MLLGQRLPTARPPRFNDAELAAWNAHRAQIKAHAESALTIEQAIELIGNPTFRWPDGS